MLLKLNLTPKLRNFISFSIEDIFINFGSQRLSRVQLIKIHFLNFAVRFNFPLTLSTFTQQNIFFQDTIFLYAFKIIWSGLVLLGGTLGSYLRSKNDYQFDAENFSGEVYRYEMRQPQGKLISTRFCSFTLELPNI